MTTSWIVRERNSRQESLKNLPREVLFDPVCISKLAETESLLPPFSQDFMEGPRTAPLTAEQAASLARVQEGLRAGWTVHVTPDGRFYYCK